MNFNMKKQGLQIIFIALLASNIGFLGLSLVNGLIPGIDLTSNIHEPHRVAEQVQPERIQFVSAQSIVPTAPASAANTQTSPSPSDNTGNN